MIAKQCIFMDEETTVHPGIHCIEENDYNYIICLCCGGIIDPREVIFKDFENWMSFDELSDIAAETDTKLKPLREAENNIRAYLENCGGIEICSNAGYQNFYDFKGFEINPLNL